MTNSPKNSTLAATGYSMPAEWEPHEATWIAWPHNRQDWPGKILPLRWVYGEIVRKICPGEIVRILVNSSGHEAQARRVIQRAGADLSRVEFLRFATDRGWARDFGPIFVRRVAPLVPGARCPAPVVNCPAPVVNSQVPGARCQVPCSLVIAKFQFTAWGNRYPDCQKDQKIPDQAAQKFGLDIVPVTLDGRPVALEGGGIDVNGRGTLLTTEECYLHPTIQVRNAGMTREQYNLVFREALGAGNAFWLKDGLVGDDTHGHVDDLCRFVNPTTVVIAKETNPQDVNYRSLKENREILSDLRLEDGGKPTIVELPMPAPLFTDNKRLPASYANFYISNAAVLVPTFNDPNDRVALGMLAELFPSRAVVGIHCVDVVLGRGTIHCLTQQQPARG